jgi:RNA recognition motif-containing protein
VVAEREKDHDMKRAYVGNIPFETTEDDLRTWFAPYVLEAAEVVRRDGKSRGFAFVEFESAAVLDAAIHDFNGLKLGGRVILVNDATEKRGRS